MTNAKTMTACITAANLALAVASGCGDAASASSSGTGGSTGTADASSGGAPADASTATVGQTGDAGSSAGGSTAIADAATEPAAGGTDGAGGAPGTGGVPIILDGGAACTVTADAATCVTRPIVTLTNGADARRVYWNEPAGTPPEKGWPSVVLYQGSFVGPAITWNTSIPKTAPFGGYYQIVLIARLLESGFVVVQPEAQGGIAWTTNTGGNYDATADAVFIPNLLDEMGKGTFGAIDTTRLYAAGISSGGYMTSRMAVSYPGRFRALAIESGSYATCLGPLCSIPAQLPADHPPTLLLHGAVDTTVPIATARDYYDKLVKNGIEAKMVEDATAGHAWIAAAPEETLAWFTTQ